jgi:hypothetical protein
VIFDDIVVGSGLGALGVVLGLPANRRILVIGGPIAGRFNYYDHTRTKVCAYIGHGGLGTYWHGVISTGGAQNFVGARAGYFQQLARHFYPHTDMSERLGKPWLFVPWRPVRPNAEWARLKAQRCDRLTFLHDVVSHFVQRSDGVSVHTAASSHRGLRVWICAGALHSPALLERSLNARVARPFVSDHVLCYLGKIDRYRTRVEPPKVERTRDGLWFEGRYDDQVRALHTRRPARFAFRRLDHGIERRRAFGRPTGNRLGSIVRGASLGLIAEALYNRTGLFRDARVQSVYAQVNVPDAHEFRSSDAQLTMRRDVIRALVDDVRANPLWTDMQKSERPDIFIPSTHLHHSVDSEALAREGVGGPESRVQVVDASTLCDAGPDHHTFKLMASAFERAQQVCHGSDVTPERHAQVTNEPAST